MLAFLGFNIGHYIVEAGVIYGIYRVGVFKGRSKNKGGFLKNLF